MELTFALEGSFLNEISPCELGQNRQHENLTNWDCSRAAGLIFTSIDSIVDIRFNSSS